MENNNFTNILIKKVTINDKEYIKSILSIEKELDLKIISKENLFEDLENEHYNYFVIKLGDKVIGYFSILKLFDMIDLNSIAISKEYQKHGIGTFALTYISNFCRKNHFKKILLEVRPSNIQARTLYEKLGFYQINIRKNYYLDNNEDAFIYEKLI